MSGVVIVVLCLMATLVYSLHKRPVAEARFFDQILERYYGEEPVPAPEVREESSLRDTLESIMARFHLFAKQLQKPRGSWPGMVIAEETDVQQVLHAILNLHGVNVLPEAVTPTHAGGSSRMDFLLDEDGLGIEVKMMRDGLRDRAVTDALIVDIERYQLEKKCKHLICFIYDPRGLLSNPRLVKRDLQNFPRNIGVSVVISPSP